MTGASRGFGLEITKAVLASGDKVVGTVRSKASELSAHFNNDPNLLIVTMDVTNEPQVKAAVQQAIDQFSQIDILINNAGYGLLSGVEEATNEEVKQNYEVNVFGTLNVIMSDYAETVGAMREFAAKVNYRQPGDPEKLAQAFIALGNSGNPPVHLPLGKDSLDRFRTKTTAFEKDVTDWFDIITGTDLDDN